MDAIANVTLTQALLIALFAGIAGCSCRHQAATPVQTRVCCCRRTGMRFAECRFPKPFRSE